MTAETKATLKPYTVHTFIPNMKTRTPKELDKLMAYSNQPVIITDIRQYWNDTLYTVIPIWSPTEIEFFVHTDELWFVKPMKIGKKNNYHLFSSDIDQFSEDDLKEVYAESFDDEPDDDDLYRIACDLTDTYYTDFMDEIEQYEKVHGESQYIVLADLGLWFGRTDGGKIISGMQNVISQCTQNMDDYEISFKNGQLCITGYHHDGTNLYVIRELKPDSEDYILRHEYDTEPRELHKHLFDSSRWSMRVKMFDILGYGGGDFLNAWT